MKGFAGRSSYHARSDVEKILACKHHYLSKALLL